jgi:YgiT-type zinc finger domain-containing protein
MMRRSIQKSKVFCPACQVGNYHLKLVTYYAWHKNDLITVPDFPSWVCDVCNRLEYDEKAVNQLRSLLASSTDARVVEHSRKKPKSLQSSVKNQRPHKTNNNQ